MSQNDTPLIKYLKVFGSTGCFLHNKTSKTKFDSKSCKCILVGYEHNRYKVWEVKNEKFAVVGVVIVEETNFLLSRRNYFYKLQ